MSRLWNNQLERQTKAGRIDKVRELLDRGVSFNRLHKDGFTALMRASYYGHVPLVEFLLDRGADPNRTSPDGASALFWASVRGHEAVVVALLATGAEVNAVRGPDDASRPKNDGPSSLNVAIHNGYLSIAERLIEAGASLDHRWLGKDIREYAEHHQVTPLVEILKKRGRRHARRVDHR